MSLVACGCLRQPDSTVGSRWEFGVAQPPQHVCLGRSLHCLKAYQLHRYIAGRLGVLFQAICNGYLACCVDLTFFQALSVSGLRV